MNKKNLIIITIMLVAVLEVLDSTIINVALPNMMPSLGANQDQITWVLTSYVVAAAIMLPLTGFLSHLFGRKQLLLIDIAGFMISSFACGTATHLNEMVFFRLLQGGFGAALIPLSQAILRESFPLEEQGKAMAIWGLGIMAAPVFGPTIGGYIVAHASWRWIFYINTPICLLGLFMTMIVIPSTYSSSKKIDLLGALCMFIGIGSLQIFLDQGNSNDWFQSNFILFLIIISIISLFVFIYRSFTHKTPVIKLAIFKDRNFSVCTLLLTLYCANLFGFIALQPLMLENLFHYTPMIAGVTMMSVGLSSAAAMILTSYLINRFPIKFILTFAVLITAFGIFDFSTLSLNAAQINFIYSDIFFGFGLGLFIVPLTTYSLATLPNEDITEAAGLFAYGRMLGTSIGISLLSTFVARTTQANWSQLGGHITIFNNNLRLWLIQQHVTIHQPQAIEKLQLTLNTQASMNAFVSSYRIISIVLIALIPLIFALKTVSLKETVNYEGH